MSNKEPTILMSVLPLRNTVLFPGQVMPLAAGRASSVAAIEAALATEDKTLVIASQKDPATDEPHFADLFPIGTRAVVKRMDRGVGGMQIIVQGVDRMELIETHQETPHLKASVRPLPEPERRDQVDHGVVDL